MTDRVIISFAVIYCIMIMNQANASNGYAICNNNFLIVMTRNCRYGRVITCVCVWCCMRNVSSNLMRPIQNESIKRCLVTGERFYAFRTTFNSEYALRINEKSRKMIVDTNWIDVYWLVKRCINELWREFCKMNRHLPHATAWNGWRRRKKKTKRVHRHFPVQ